jgi:hypothetical protein
MLRPRFTREDHRPYRPARKCFQGVPTSVSVVEWPKPRMRLRLSYLLESLLKKKIRSRGGSHFSSALQESSASDPDIFDRQLDFFFDEGRNTALAMHAADMIVAMFNDFFFGLSPNHEFTFHASIPAAELFIFSYPGHRHSPFFLI